ncbi:ABC transporter ATP-binding protein [Paenibacillus sp. J22TS3]|uniref:ABC transporter ATP-binding protein n=1 Tax=Paenibacillus sp. J22TS3 TaxID=2807192 RepID=UPI001B2A28AB|nr:ABC transporter ATP-binding protein [Paenibacillus sp. J22TS3]GIP24454.1 ABC transporter ATP-binding protein [Paenibacillus sp. J22TS3]
MQTVITMDHVDKEYKGTSAVKDLSLTIQEGTVTALLGPNGAGKTTTVSMLLGLQKPTRGQIRILGGAPDEPQARQSVGAMLQDISVIDRLTVRETIELFRSYYAKPLALSSLLAMAGLDKEQNKFATSLSGGQKRRLDFALAMAGDPKILYLDEPTVGMDVGSRQLFWESVRAMAGKGRTIILTTHYLDEADSIADRIVVINQGKLIADGTPAQIKSAQGRRVITFTAGERLKPDALSGIPGILETVWSGRKVKLSSPDTDQLIRTLLSRDLDIRDIEISAGGLEDAFQTLIQGDASL